MYRRTLVYFCVFGLLAMFCVAAVTASRAASGQASSPATRASAAGQDWAAGSRAAVDGAFTYQGQLSLDGVPVNNTCDFRFGLWDAASDGTLAGSGWLERPAVAVANGFFTVPDLDFGPGAFDGAARWLEVQVQCPGEAVFTSLGRTELTATPYALFALAAPWDGLVGIPAAFADEQDNDLLGGIVCASGEVVKWGGAGWQCAADLDSDTTYTAGEGLSLSSGAFSVQFAGGGSATTAARSDHDHAGVYSLVGHLHDLVYVNDNAGEVDNADIPAGALSPDRISGGAWTAGNDGSGSGLDADLLDGQQASAFASAGHAHDTRYWMLGGSGGLSAATAVLGTTDAVTFTLVVSGQTALRVVPTSGSPNWIGGSSANRGGLSAASVFIGGGDNNSVLNTYGAIVGGVSHQVTNDFGFIGGGQENQNASYRGAIVGGGVNVLGNYHDAFIGGGYNNEVNGMYGIIVGGDDNRVSADRGAVLGGSSNQVSGGAAAIAGGTANTASGGASFIGSGNLNATPGTYAVVGGGEGNQAQGTWSVVGGGYEVSASGDSAVVVGGFHNYASGWGSFVGSGEGNNAGGWLTVIGGGGGFFGEYGFGGNTAMDDFGVIGGGWGNRTGIPSRDPWDGALSVVGGGFSNWASGLASTVPGGWDNLAAGAYSFAAGKQALALNDGSFVWADGISQTFTSTVDNQFAVRATGGVRLETAGAGLAVDGERVLTEADTPALANPSITAEQIALLKWYPANKTGRSFPVGQAPRGLAYDGESMWIANSGDNTVSRISLNGVTLGTYPVGSVPVEVAYDGVFIWVANAGNDTVSVLWASNGALAATLNVNSQPYGLAFDGFNMWVTCKNTDEVMVFSVTNFQVFQTLSTGSQPVGIAYDGRWMWVVNSGDGANPGSVSVFNASTFEHAITPTVGVSPQYIAYDGAKMWVTNYGDDTVSVLNAADGSLVWTLDQVRAPYDLAFDGTRMWVTNTLGGALGSASVIRVLDGVLVETIPGGDNTLGIAFDGGFMWLTNAGNDTVSKR